MQTWILRERITPITAVVQGKDAAICGDCPYRANRGCYVNVAHAPNQVWKAFKRGTYAPAVLAEASKLAQGLKVRLGSYGDPAAVPVAVWKALVRRAAGWTGYTHQWKRPEFQPFRNLVMASCDSVEERTAAKAAGWRTFRVKPRGAPRLHREAACPASTEMGERTDCYTCNGCNGSNGRKLDFVIDAHGAKARTVELVQIGGG